jgi:hypothetical protein
MHWTQRLNGAVALAGSLGRPAPGRGQAVSDLISLR